MKTIHLGLPIIFSLIVNLVIVSSLSAQDCGNCPERHVILYDFDVQVPRPRDNAKIIQWQQLFKAPFVVADVTFNDPTAGCLQFFDATLVGWNASISDTINFGLNRVRLAPQGEIPGFNYVISGVITGNEGAYTVAINLETACSREIVTSGSTSFTSANEIASITNILAKELFSPINTKIQQFEENERNAKTEVARDVTSDQIVIKPSKKEAKRAETVPVQISLLDCDGSPLANRTITLQDPRFESENGSFTTQTVRTDAQGIARTNFLTGLMPGVAILRVSFAYTNPWGCETIVDASTIIVIEDPLPNQYVIEAKLSYLKTSTYNWSGNVYIGDCGGYQEQKTEEELKKTMTITAICENTGGQEAEGIVELVSTTAVAHGSKDERDEHTSYIGGGPCHGVPFSERRVSSLVFYSGPVLSGFDEDGNPLSSVSFTYNPNDPDSQLFNFSMSGSIMEQYRLDEWIYETPEKQGDQAIVTNIAATTELSQIVQEIYPEVGGKIKVVGSGYVIDFDFNESTEGSDQGHGPTKINETISIHATIKPLFEYLKNK